MKSFSDALGYKAKFIPATGFNLVSFDDFDLDSPLSLLGHYTDRAGAERAKARLEKSANGLKYYIYASTDGR